MTSFTRLEPTRTAPSRLPAKQEAIALAAGVGVTATTATLIYSPGNLMHSMFNPVWQVSDDKGTVYVETNGRVYRASDRGTFFMYQNADKRTALERIR